MLTWLSKKLYMYEYNVRVYSAQVKGRIANEKKTMLSRRPAIHMRERPSRKEGILKPTEIQERKKKLKSFLNPLRTPVPVTNYL